MIALDADPRVKYTIELESHPPIEDDTDPIFRMARSACPGATATHTGHRHFIYTTLSMLFVFCVTADAIRRERIRIKTDISHNNFTTLYTSHYLATRSQKVSTQKYWYIHIMIHMEHGRKRGAGGAV